MLAGGVIFQLPLAILAVTRLGIVSVAQLSSNRRYAYLADRDPRRRAARRRPGLDADRDGPALVLYELSILLARAFGEPAAAGGMVKPSTQER